MRIAIVSLIAALALGSGVAVAQSAAAPRPVVVAQASAAPAPAPSPLSTIHIKNFGYIPDTVTITAGAVVKFVQDDETPHTVTASDGSFDSGNLNQKQTWSHTFARPGTYNYFCAYHTYMKAKIIVSGP